MDSGSLFLCMCTKKKWDQVSLSIGLLSDTVSYKSPVSGNEAVDISGNGCYLYGSKTDNI